MDYTRSFGQRINIIGRLFSKNLNKQIMNTGLTSNQWPIITRLLLQLWVMYFLAASVGLMIIGHIMSIAETQANWENGYYLIILIAIFSTLGRVVGGWLSDRFGRLTVIKIVFFILATNLLLFVSYSSATNLQ